MGATNGRYLTTTVNQKITKNKPFRMALGIFKYGLEGMDGGTAGEGATGKGPKGSVVGGGVGKGPKGSGVGGGVGKGAKGGGVGKPP